MKMKNSVISALLALGMTACVESTPSLQVGGATAQAADCSIGGNAVGLLAGSLNLGIRGASYPLVLEINSNLNVVPVDVNDQPVTADPDLNTIYITELVLGYSSPTEGLSIEDAGGTVPIYGTVFEGSNMQVNLFTSDVAAALTSFVTPGVSADVLVNLQLRGKRASGDEMESNEIVFPVSVGNFPFSCPPGFRIAASTDPCPQAGLNGVVPECEEATP
jgi:hypothetical protein